MNVVSRTVRYFMIMKKSSLTIQAFAIIAVTQVMGLVCWNLVPRLAPLLLDQAGASPAAISWILGTLPQMMVLILTPAISVWSDNHHSPWGRRRPFLWWSAPPFCLSLLCIYFSSGNGTLLASSLLFFALCAIIPATLVFYIVPEVIPLNCIGRFTAWNGALSSLCAALFNYCGLSWSSKHPLSAFLIAIICYMTAMASLAVIPKEGKDAETKQETERCLAKIWAASRDCVRDSLCNKIYLMFFLSMGFNQASMILRSLFGILFATKELGMDVGDFGHVSGICACLGAVTAVLLGRYVDRHSPIVFYLNGSLAVIAVSLAGFFFVNSPGNYRVVAFLTTICYSFQSIAYTPLLVTMFPQDKYGQFSSVNTTVCTLMVMGGAAAGGWLTNYMGFRFIFLWDFIMTSLGTLFLFGVKKMQAPQGLSTEQH